MTLKLADNLKLPDAILSQHVVMLGKTGSGKSSALRFIVEDLLARGKRVCVIDPKGDWWGVKVAADGKGPGLPVILFGDFKNEAARDVPINDRSGRHIAELVSDGNRPCIIGLRGWTQGAMTRLWVDFSSTLFAKNAGELFLVGDEFHNFAPKQYKGKSDDDTQTGIGLHWANRLLSEGRGLGLVCLIASQRPQKVHNDTLTSCETLVAMRVIHAADRAAVKAWIDGNGDDELGNGVLKSLAGMQRGEAWIWSPEIEFGPKRCKFPMFGTFDSFAPPQLQKRVSGKGWADVDLAEVKAALAEAVKEAEAKDPKLLRAKIADLERQLDKAAKSPHVVAQAKPPKRVEVPFIAPALIDRAEKAAARVENAIAKAAALLTSKPVADAAELLKNVHLDLVEAKARLNGHSMALAPSPKAPVQGKEAIRQTEKVKHPFSSRPKPAPADTGDVKLGPSERAILTAFYWLRGQQATPSLVSFYSGYSTSSSTWDRALGRVRHGWVNGWSITPQGEALVESWGVQAKPSGRELREWLRPKLDRACNQVLDVLIDKHPERVMSEDLASAANYSTNSSTWDRTIGRLRALEAAEGYDKDGGVRAADVFFA